MNLLLSPDQELLRDTTRRFLEAEWPLAAVRALGESGEWPKQVWRRGAELGWVSLLGPEQLGGGGLAGQGLLDLAIVAEEMGRLVSPAPLVPANIGVMAMAAAGSDHVDTVERIMAGELVPAWCLAEPGDAWSGDDVSAEAVPDGSDLIVDGVKLPVEAATYADLFIVVARTGPGLTQVVVPADAPGVSVEPMRTVDLVRSFGIVRLDGVRLPRSAALGSLGGATAAVEQQLLTAVALQCAETVGAMQRVLDFTVEYAFDRVSFGRPLASYQALKHRFADLKTWLEASAAAADGA
ncbi:MAG TPA: acyl-CoA dehydrogenase, partial [Acidimicrobiales bacterium]|nr:acyl-CoA dehydrogenase [Acidimicrobiales bacterium]